MPGAPVTIASSTNANPSAVTMSGAHGLVSGMQLTIAGHVTNTAINLTNNAGATINFTGGGLVIVIQPVKEGTLVMSLLPLTPH